ncbi:hypothetical protein S7711_11553 [Stachybotrys chartarum IBT 7711]|uniref:Zn(2)-C6 fungal-type domain-containing protein n=1 Tax=Stachybotrys chartarum (strain CBS 109288 / IBT 7711) TaxID=1280523 RepID=A0A084B5P8_STACB|nr:hypothetical protein S7711_11553 [Stachybotrys chartarum IBT 7711]KFA56026.1 hypothetical protein S40293_10769 [Stachybotrys chartarum IBT 40293]
MLQEKPLRFACDRCHAQKLRCPRAVDPDKNRPDEPCSRCRKADVPCVVSERGKVGRPAKVSKRKASPGLAHSHSHSSRSSVSSSYDRSSIPPVAAPMADPVFFTPRSSPVPGLSPPRSDEHMMCDPDYTTAFYDAGSAMMTPMAHLTEAVFGMPSTGSDDSSEVNGAGWASHSNWSDTTSHPTPGLPDAHMPYRLDFDLNLDLSAPFTGAGDMLDVAPDMPYLAKSDPSAALFEPAAMQSMPMPKPSPPTSSPMPSRAPSSSATHFYKLTTLNAKILQFLETYRHTPMLDDAGSMNQVTKEVVEFSGELIEIARQVMPGNGGRGLGIDSGASDVSSVPSLEDDGSRGTSRMPSRSSSVDDFAMFEADQHMVPTIPQSAIIFLLLGCYTQLLHSFEFTVYSLHKRHAKSNQLDMNMWKHPDTIDSLLKASLVIHTVTYLLDCVHRAFSGVQPEAPDFASFAEAGECSTWKGFFWGQSDNFAKDGLLTQAFVEIQEREQSVMRKAHHLKQAISRFHI